MQYEMQQYAVDSDAGNQVNPLYSEPQLAGYIAHCNLHLHSCIPVLDLEQHLPGGSDGSCQQEVMDADGRVLEAGPGHDFSSSQLVELPDEHFTAEEFQQQDHELDLVSYDMHHHDQLEHEEQSQHHLFHHHYQPVECDELLQEQQNILQQHEQGIHTYKSLAATTPNSRFAFCVEEPGECASPIPDSDDEENDRVANGSRTCQLVCETPGAIHSPFPALAGGDSSGGCLPAGHNSNENQPPPESLSDTQRQSSSSSPAQQIQTKRKRMKQVQVRLDSAAHQNLMKLVTEQHNGSVENFVSSTIAESMLRSQSAKRVPSRKPAVSKWKRLRFDQLKGSDTQELALAYRSLASSSLGLELTDCLLQTSWEDLTIAQMEKMLEETQQMLLLMEKQHVCLEVGCGRRFPTPGMLRDHMNEHSGERPYVCTFEGCLSSFASKQFLCRHLKKHERAFVCPVDGCNKRFAFRERLVVHQKTHESDRPLTCPYEGCDKTFKWLNSLNGHLRTHTGEKPYKCSHPECGRDFGYKVDLTRHERTHYGQPARLHR